MAAKKEEARATSTDRRATWSWKRLFGKDNHTLVAESAVTPFQEEDESTPRAGLARRLSQRVIPGLPRAKTFKRQQSELRDRLEPDTDERRAASVDRRLKDAFQISSTALASPCRLSAPELSASETAIATVNEVLGAKEPAGGPLFVDRPGEYVEDEKVVSIFDAQSVASELGEEQLHEELESRWILNLSMHFRDKSRREKFFVTFAETPTHWRRVTVSLDYRGAPPGSLEDEISNLKFQRDKNARIYEAIRDSLMDIQFYDTVTNLKLQTEDGRLHVHVVEDLSEIIQYPLVNSVKHLNCKMVREDELVFDSHLSGFVYKVTVDGGVSIKKEIPGPDQVDEFLYEINALHQLSASASVIQFGGVVLDKRGETVKGLLISFAEKGALVDMIFDTNGSLSWKRRERWARQITEGLAEIHESGFVQGDFTLSNIVIDEYDNAKIIDINRRGCPVGWEPPEVATLIESGQRISMYIGVKSDLFQLGMVLYALAIQHDEPESLRPLSVASFPTMGVPIYYQEICSRCLDSDPRRRSQATVLLGLFPSVEAECHDTPDRLIIDARHTDEGMSPSEDDDYPQRGRSPSTPYDMTNHKSSKSFRESNGWGQPNPPETAASVDDVEYIRDIINTTENLRPKQCEANAEQDGQKASRLPELQHDRVAYNESEEPVSGAHETDNVDTAILPDSLPSGYRVPITRPPAAAEVDMEEVFTPTDNGAHSHSRKELFRVLPIADSPSDQEPAGEIVSRPLTLDIKQHSVAPGHGELKSSFVQDLDTPFHQPDPAVDEDRLEMNYTTSPREPRVLAVDLDAYPEDLTGIGSVHTAYSVLYPPAFLEDEIA